MKSSTCRACKKQLPVTHCNKFACPYLTKFQAQLKVKKLLTKESFQTASPSPFIGRFGYPNINVGVLTPLEKTEDTQIYDAPRSWSKNNTQIPQLVNLRSELINSRFKTQVKPSSSRTQNKLLELTQEVGMAKKPVDLEIDLQKKPTLKIQADSYSAPMGPNAQLKKATLTQNPTTSKKVEKVVDDHHLKANEAAKYLRKKGYDEQTITKLLSVGLLGLKKDRKLVPTRWAITASDDLLGKQLLQEIKKYKTGEYQAQLGSYLGNHYLLLFFPEVWSYELFELFTTDNNKNPSQELHYSTDFEPYKGRTNYAHECAGGYYTVRLAILEHLKKIKRQASVLAIRCITDDYTLPMGVWVTREATRITLKQKPITFASKELMLTYATHLIKKKFGITLNKLTKKSILLNNINNQRKLTKFL